jgi:hypothetical protein
MSVIMESTHWHSTVWVPDTVTTLQLHVVSDDTSAIVTVDIVPADNTLLWWSEPSAETVREWVDSLLVGTPYVRVGKRQQTGTLRHGWQYVYFTRKV